MCWIFQVGSQVQQTAVAHKTYDAAFTEVFEFTGDGDPPANVSIIVMDWDKLSKDDYVGEATGFCVVLGRRMWAVARRQRRTWIGCGAGATGMDGCLYCVCVPACMFWGRKEGRPNFLDDVGTLYCLCIDKHHDSFVCAACSDAMTACIWAASFSACPSLFCQCTARVWG